MRRQYHVNLQCSQEAANSMKIAFNRYRHFSSKRDPASRLVEWFAEQPLATQGAIIHGDKYGYGKSAAELIARRILDRDSSRE